ncbi:hypothetical protein K438DRAFT_2014782 [Mycena galopus ATCC 62051]|nr:hypothetical protein K438DRAFT_2014782 [Mycena galopus ATCC 62051]
MPPSSRRARNLKIIDVWMCLACTFLIFYSSPGSSENAHISVRVPQAALVNHPHDSRGRHRHTFTRRNSTIGCIDMLPSPSPPSSRGVSGVGGEAVGGPALTSLGVELVEIEGIRSSPAPTPRRKVEFVQVGVIAAKASLEFCGDSRHDQRGAVHMHVGGRHPPGGGDYSPAQRDEQPPDCAAVRGTVAGRGPHHVKARMPSRMRSDLARGFASRPRPHLHSKILNASKVVHFVHLDSERAHEWSYPNVQYPYSRRELSLS